MRNPLEAGFGIYDLARIQQPEPGLDGTSRTSFCSGTHHLEAVRSEEIDLCLWCGERPKVTIDGELSDFCSIECREEVYSSAPLILSVSEDTESFTDVLAQFKDQWKHPSPAPSIVKIWKIYCNKDLTDKFQSYKLAVERRTGYPGGNIKRRWHGTSRACTIGDRERRSKLCRNESCSLCGIIRKSFVINRELRGTAMYGAGIYTSATSSKASDYAVQRGKSPYRALLLNEVVMGKTIRMATPDGNLVEPPAGFDSIIAEPGIVLRFDEAIVYRDEAIRPLFLVIYEVPQPKDVASNEPCRRKRRNMKDGQDL